MSRSFFRDTVAFSFCIFGCLPFVSHAADSAIDAEIAARFAKCDVNHDGKLTKEEANGCMPRIYNNFSYLDSGNKGYLTVAEIQAAAR
jgi:Ca2+-binding EF-hand superfamily protein